MSVCFAPAVGSGVVEVTGNPGDRFRDGVGFLDVDENASCAAMCQELFCVFAGQAEVSN